ncbi:hypothetical protein [Haloterrigena salinisoli]|uniref:hypothetical protein n=1 Tax=Haloterrigena salinisoli TaxID=3132747 RepID=UPI0030D3F12F
MTSNIPFTSGGTNSVVAALSVLIGAMAFGYGLLLVPASVLGGGWIAAIGLALILSGLFAADAVADRLGLAPNRRRRLSLLFAALALVLAVAFVAINGATFESEAFESAAAAIRG